MVEKKDVFCENDKSPDGQWPVLNLFMVFAACLDGLSPVNLLQNHDSRQMVREGHGTHGKLEVRLLLNSG